MYAHSIRTTSKNYKVNLVGIGISIGCPFFEAIVQREVFPNYGNMCPADGAEGRVDAKFLTEGS